MLNFLFFYIRMCRFVLKKFSFYKTAAEHAQQSAQEAAGELASQQSMVGQAKQRVELIEEQLHAAR